MAMREKKGAVWKEKKKSTSTDSHSIPPSTSAATSTGHKTALKQSSTSSSPEPQKPHPPTNRRPTLITRYEQTASKLPRKPASSPSSSVAPKPTPKPTPKPINDRRSSLSGPSSHKSLHPLSPKIAAGPSKPLTRTSSGGRASVLSGKQKIVRRSNTMGSASARKDNHRPKGPNSSEDGSVETPVSCNSPPDLMDNVSIIESEHEEAEGMMCYEIDQELDQIESRGMSPTQIPMLETCTSMISEEIGSRISAGDDADEDSRGGGGDEIKECDVVEVNSEAEKERIVKKVEDAEVESVKEEGVKEEVVKNTTVSRQSGGKYKKDSPAYNDVIEETASKLLEKRKNKVRALVGAFETVISLQEPEQVPEPELPEHEHKVEREHNKYESKTKEEDTKPKEDSKDTKVEEVKENEKEPEPEQKQEPHPEKEEKKEPMLEKELPLPQDS